MILYRTIGNGLIRPLIRALYRIEGTGWEHIPAAAQAEARATEGVRPVAEPLDLSAGTLEELTAEAKRRVEELRRPYGPPAHVWFD